MVAFSFTVSLNAGTFEITIVDIPCPVVFHVNLATKAMFDNTSRHVQLQTSTLCVLTVST